MKNNFMEITFPAKSVNEGLARTCVASFCLPLNPSVDELTDIKTAVSEAVTNCVVHAYGKMGGLVNLRCELDGDEVVIVVRDNGVGIKDIAKAREPFFTTAKSEERSGMGFSVMEAFMDELNVESNDGRGLKVTMRKHINRAQEVGANA